MNRNMSKVGKNSPTELKSLSAGLLGIFAGLSFIIVLASLAGGETSPAGTKVRDFPAPEPPGRVALLRDELTAATWKQIGVRLKEARRYEEELGRSTVTELRAFFAASKERVPAFAEAVLSLTGKWELVKSTVSGGKGHAEYLEREFGRIVFTPEDLETVTRQAIKNYTRGVTVIEDQLFVKIKSDLEGLPASEVILAARPEEEVRRLKEVLSGAGGVIKGSIPVDILAFAGSAAGSAALMPFAGRLASSVATRLGLSTGILSAGALTSVETFGIGFIVAIVTDQVISQAVDALYDPAGKITDKVRALVDATEAVILTGDANSPGLTIRLKEACERRSMLRETVLRRLVFESSSK